MAGPLFNEGERWWIEERVCATVESCGFTTFLPHRDNPPKTKDNTRVIYENDRGAIDECIAVVADFNGVTTDDGTAWEVGYACGLGKPVVGIFTDWRERFPNECEVVNLMLQFSVTKLVRSLDDLPAALAEAVASAGPRGLSEPEAGGTCAA